MRTRITRTLLAVAAAGATATTLGFAAAGAASAANVSSPTNPPSGGSPIYTDANCTNSTCAMAGYQASGRDFRFAQAVIKVPTTAGSVATSPQFYVGLNDGKVSLNSSPGGFAHAGIQPCTTGPGCANGWEGYYQVFQGGTPTVNVTVPFTGVAGGDGVFFSVYLNAVGNAVRFVVTLPNGDTVGRTVAVNGPVYDYAVATADWSNSGQTPVPTPPAATTRLTQFFQGRFTTLSGQQGTFNGPWTLNPVETTTNGFATPRGTLIAAPAFLWTDGNSYKGLWGDAFGVYLYSS